jgi:chromodomain-helicase-DNA-binding protein 7
MEMSLRQKIKRFDTNYEQHINLKFLNSTKFRRDDWVDDCPEDSFMEFQERRPPLPKSSERDPKFERYIKRTFMNSEMNYINFDQNTLKVDRVVSCSEMFDIIHPKKAGKIMSKWSDSIVKIVQILINFRYENVTF